MSDSGLVNYRNLTRNYSRRTAAISKITIHHAAGVGSAKSIVDGFIPAARKASANYCIGNDGQIGQSVSEAHRAWTSSNQWNDNQAITIEVSNSQRGGDWPISDAAYAALINLCVDICQRNGIKAVNYTGTKQGIPPSTEPARSGGLNVMCEDIVKAKYNHMYDCHLPQKFNKKKSLICISFGSNSHDIRHNTVTPNHIGPVPIKKFPIR